MSEQIRNNSMQKPWDQFIWFQIEFIGLYMDSYLSWTYHYLGISLHKSDTWQLY